MRVGLPFVPMEPVQVNEVNESGDFLFQVKWDGFRLVCVKESGTVALWTRNGRERTEKYPEVTEALLAIPGDFWVDGELVAFGADGKPCFHQLLKRDKAKHVRRDIPAALMLFDCIMRSGKMLQSLPLELRTEILSELVPTPGRIQTCDFYSDGQALFDRMQALGMEGVVAKRKGSMYVPGAKTPLWQKVKCWRQLQAKPVSIRFREGRPVSLGVVTADSDELPIGNVSSGLSASDLQQFSRLALQGKAAPQSGVLPLPALTLLDVRYIELTPGGQLRSPSVLRILQP